MKMNTIMLTEHVFMYINHTWPFDTHL